MPCKPWGEAREMRLILLVSVLGLVSAIHGLAQLIGCNLENAGYKILLDDIVFPSPGASGPNAQVFASRLRMRLRSDIEALKAETHLPFTIIRCEGRRPSGEEDFRDTLVDGLNSRNVLVELWGQILPGESGADAAIGFALIPVRFYDRRDPDLPGIYDVSYTVRNAGPDRILEMISGASELRAFVLLAGGVKAFREKRYDEAYASLCAGTALVGRLRSSALQNSRKPLGDYARLLAARTVRTALQDASYHGVLGLLNPGDDKQICPAR